MIRSPSASSDPPPSGGDAGPFERLQRENEELRRLLGEADDALRAIREGQGETVYRLAVETMAEGALNVTPEGRILFCNEQFARFIKTPSHQLLGRDVTAFVAPREVEAFREMLRQCLEEPVRKRVVFRAPDGTLTATHLSGHVLFQPEGASLCLVAADLSELERSAGQVERLRKDKQALERAESELRSARLAALNLMEDAVSDRRRAEESAEALRQSQDELQRSNARLDLLVSTGGELLRSESPHAMVEHLCQRVLEVLDCQVFFNYLVDQASGRLRLNASGGLPPGAAADLEWLDFGASVCGCMARDGSPFVAEDVGNRDDPQTGLVKRLGVQAYACHPLIVEGQLIGTLSFGARNRPRFTEEEVAVMCAVSGQVAIAIARQNTTQVLREREERFRGTFENAAVGIAHQSLDGRWLRVNAKLCEITGFSEEELLRKSAGDITHPDDVAKEVAQTQKILAGEIASYWLEKRYVRKDGSLTWVTLTVSLMRRLDGVPDYLIKVVRDIGLRKRAEAELAASRQRLAGIVESAMDGIISVDARQQIVLFNRAAQTMFRCPEADALGSTLGRFIPERFRAAHGEHVTRFGANGETSRAMGALGGPLRALRANGEEFPIEASISRTDPGGERLFTVILRDVTERLQAEQAVRESEERLRLAAQAAGFGTYDFDPLRCTVVWSPELFAIFGVPETAEPGTLLVRELAHPDDRAAFDAMVGRTLDPAGPGRHALEYRLLRPDGEERWIRDVGRTFFEGEGANARAVRLIGTVQDITELKKTELELKESLRDLRSAQQQLVVRERLATLGLLSGRVAHELRTPLAVINNAIYFLKRVVALEAEDIRDSFGEIERAIHYSNSIIGEMLDYVREPSQQAADFPIERAIGSALQLVSLPGNIRLLRSAEGSALQVRASEDQVTRILVNLITNAVQAMPDGGELEIGAAAAIGNKVCVKVRDTGCGIAPENLAKIFEPLFTTKIKGIGLGLAICHRYAELNNGWIFAESTPGQGTTFRVIFNAREEVPSPEPATGPA